MAAQDTFIVGVIIAFFAALLALMFITDRRRKRQLAESLDALGLKSSLDDPTLLASEAFARIGPLTRLSLAGGDTTWQPRKQPGVLWHAQGQIDGVPITLLENWYRVRWMGRNGGVYHTIAATPCPSSWPTLAVTNAHPLQKIAELVGAEDIQVKDQDFDSRWRVKSESEDFAVLALSPQVQRFLSNLAPGTWLEIGQGAICLVRKKQLKGEEAARLVHSLTELARLLPPELKAWQGS